MQEVTKEDIEELEAIYGFQVKEEWFNGNMTKISCKLDEERYWGGVIHAIKVDDIIYNERKTLALIKLGSHLFRVKAEAIRPNEVLFLDVDYDFRYTVEDFRDRWVLAYGNYEIPALALVIDAQTEEEVKEILETINRIATTIKKYSYLPEVKDNQYLHLDNGIITKEILEDFEEHMKTVVQLGLKAEAEEEKKKQEALNNVVLTDNKVEFIALNGGKYSLESSLKLNVNKEMFLPVIYCHRKEAVYKQYIDVMRTIGEIVSALMRQHPEGEITIGKDGRKITLGWEVKQRKDGTTAVFYFLNGRRVKNDYAWKTVYSYIEDNVPIDWDEIEVKRVSKTGKRELSPKARVILEEGIRGEIRDEEGTFPFHLTVKRKNDKWYLVIGGKEIYIKGGFSVIERLDNMATGKALYWEDRQKTSSFYKKLKEIVGKETAKEIIKTIKETAILWGAVE